MKNKAVKKLVACQHNVSEDDVTVEFLSSFTKDESYPPNKSVVYEFEVSVTFFDPYTNVPIQVKTYTIKIESIENKSFLL